MRMIRLTAVLLAAAVTLNMPVRAFDVSARSAIVIEATGGTVVYEKDADTRRPMASTTKIMTALCAIESGRMDDTVTVSPDAVGVEGSSLYLKAGDRLTLEALVKAVLLESANDAAAAIAVALDGSVEAFAERMNSKAAQLGLVNTHFKNPHGLSDEEHYTTARELAQLAAYAMQNEDFRSIASSISDSIDCGGSERAISNHNKLLRIYEGAVGVKTGFTKVSGRCLVSAAERDGMMLVAVTLDAPDDWNDHTAMLDLGFDTLCRRVLIPEGEFAAIVPCLGGDTDRIHVKSCEGLAVIMKRDECDITSRVILPHHFWAPIKKGQKVGRLEFYADGTPLGSVALYSDTEAFGVSYDKNIFERFLG